MTVLVHSYSSCVLDVLKFAHQNGNNIKIITTEAQPSNTSRLMREKCSEAGIECQEIYDTAVASILPMVDCVAIGCEAVLANGGVVNKIGTYGIAIIASHFKKPVYVFCESYKFNDTFPLGQDDVAEMIETQEGKDTFHMKVDYTPPEHLNLFFTDMGIFTASAISDELTQFFAN